jgi:hypothetical protein
LSIFLYKIDDTFSIDDIKNFYSLLKTSIPTHLEIHVNNIIMLKLYVVRYNFTNVNTKYIREGITKKNFINKCIKNDNKILINDNSNIFTINKIIYKEINNDKFSKIWKFNSNNIFVVSIDNVTKYLLLIKPLYN